MGKVFEVWSLLRGNQSKGFSNTILNSLIRHIHGDDEVLIDSSKKTSLSCQPRWADRHSTEWWGADKRSEEGIPGHD